MNFALSELLLVFLFGALAAPLPVGVPPLPEDPVLLRVAPADAIAYFAWFGTAEADRDSVNRTEALAAEPEIRAFFARLLAATRGSLEANTRREQGAESLLAMFDLGVKALQRPGCMFISSLDQRARDFPLQGGLVVNLGDDTAMATAVVRNLESLIAMAAGAGDQPTANDPAPIQGVQFRALPLPAQAPPITWTVTDGYLAIAVGADVPAQIVAGLKGDPGFGGNRTVAALRAKVAVERPSTRIYVDTGRLVKLALEAGGEEVKTVLATFGLDQARTLFSESGLEGDGYVARTQLAVTEPTGLIGLLSQRPLGVDDLAIVPGDATLAMALSIDPDAALDWFVDMVDTMEPGAREQFGRQVEGPFAQIAGVRLREDLLAHLGHSVTLWSSPSQGGILFTGATAAIPLKDGPAFRKSFATLMENMTAIAPKKERDDRGRFRRDVYMEQTAGGEQTIYFLNTVGDDDVPFTPAWCVTDSHLMVSLFPQMLKATLARGPHLAALDRSLARKPGIAGHSRAVAISYSDAQQLVGLLYPLLLPFGQIAASEMQREGFDLSIADLPTMGAIMPHLGAEIGVLQSDDDGLLFTRRGSLPMADPMIGAIVPLSVFPLFYFRMAQGQRVMAAERDMALRRAMEAERAKAKAEAERLRRELEKKKKDEKKKDDGARRQAA